MREKQNRPVIACCSWRFDTYQLAAEKSGFSRHLKEGIVLTVNPVATQPVTLRMVAVSQQVTVNANASTVTTDSATVGELVNEKQIVDLPLNGRQAQTLLFLAKLKFPALDAAGGEGNYGFLQRSVGQS